GRRGQALRGREGHGRRPRRPLGRRRRGPPPRLRQARRRRGRRHCPAAVHGRHRRCLRGRAREPRAPDPGADGVMGLMLAHGIGGIQNLPIPRWVFFAGAAGILTISFLGLFFLRPRPVLAEKNRGGRTFPRWLERFLLSRGLRVVVGSLSFALLAFLWFGALVGKDDSGVNFTPT